MWPGQQPPGGEQNTQGQPPYGQGQSPNPYQQPVGYPQPGQPPWAAPTLPAGAPQPPPDGRGKTTVVAVVAAAAVVVAAAVTGVLVLGGDSDDKAGPGPTGQASPSGSAGGDDNPRTGNDVEPVIPGWKTVVRGTVAYDVPAEWGVRSKGWVSYVADDNDPDEKPLVGFGGVATLKEQWCQSDDDKDGSPTDFPLGDTGTRVESGAKTAAETAGKNAGLWVYGGYAQPDKKKITTGASLAYTTESGLRGSVATATSSGVEKTGKCDTDGKATTFVFKNAKNDFMSWTFVGVTGVKDEVPEATVKRILSTVRLISAPQTP